ncbi:hypothetical protein [Roseimicrobium sp. ORNL1]|uniref:hypothetical protein n=1 Tax=Roseimicrobium sp. ORNL1 TaxID=2711231 RepID=UPI0013E13CF2|nr:hypothetical protein [Roseimicrobium sp. ORNL1]QIF05629.1 hypothetical protein G5S37_30390 [Roseimicrobium sp. ORNL1]
MPRPIKIVLLIAILVLISAVGWYVVPRWTQRDPLTIRVLEFKRVSADRVAVKYEVENTSPYDVLGMVFLEFHGAHLAGRFDELSYLVEDHFWEGKVLQPGFRKTIDTEFSLADSDASSPQYFLYAWDPMPAHLLRKMIPAYRKNMDKGSLRVRIGSDGPFVLTDKDVSRAQP